MPCRVQKDGLVLHKKASVLGPKSAIVAGRPGCHEAEADGRILRCDTECESAAVQSVTCVCRTNAPDGAEILDPQLETAAAAHQRQWVQRVHNLCVARRRYL